MDVVSWYYDPDENLFRDEDGWIIYDIYRVIPPWRFKHLKNVRGVEYLRKETEGIMYELVFPLKEDYDE
jgi:hypothetical protein